MAEYWYQRAEGDEVEGPCTGTQLKALAVGGQITPDSMITGDGTTWHRAGSVGKLFPPAPVAPSAPPAAMTPRRPAPPRASAPANSPPVQTAPAPQYAPQPQYAPAHQYAAAPQYPAPATQHAAAPAAPVSLPYATPGQRSVAVGWVGKPRGTLPFLLLALLLLASNIAAGAAFYMNAHTRAQSFALPVMLFLASFLIGIGTLVYWLVLVYAVHNDMRNYTGGTYKVSPGAAVGFSFIPAFSAYWIVYMPWKLLSEVRMHLHERASEASPALVMTFQIISIPFALIFGPGAAALMYALSMMQIQKGLNALWRQRA